MQRGIPELERESEAWPLPGDRGRRAGSSSGIVRGDPHEYPHRASFWINLEYLETDLSGFSFALGTDMCPQTVPCIRFAPQDAVAEAEETAKAGLVPWRDVFFGLSSCVVLPVAGTTKRHFRWATFLVPCAS